MTMENETEKLLPVGSDNLVVPLPCPFCGSAAELDYDEDSKLAGKPFYRCSDSETCRVFGPDGETVAEALERWNQRARCDFCQEIPLTPAERKHTESIRHNGGRIAEHAMNKIEELYNYISGDDDGLPKQERLRLIAHRILEDIGGEADEEPAPRMIQMEIPVRFNGHVHVLVPEYVPVAFRYEIASKLALARILATTQNPDCGEAECDALEELQEAFVSIREGLGEVWDRCQTCGASGAWEAITMKQDNRPEV